MATADSCTPGHRAVFYVSGVLDPSALERYCYSAQPRQLPLRLRRAWIDPELPIGDPEQGYRNSTPRVQGGRCLLCNLPVWHSFLCGNGNMKPRQIFNIPSFAMLHVCNPDCPSDGHTKFVRPASAASYQIKVNLSSVSVTGVRASCAGSQAR